jgi:hypothetical protein
VRCVPEHGAEEDIGARRSFTIYRLLLTNYQDAHIGEDEMVVACGNRNAYRVLVGKLDGK